MPLSPLDGVAHVVQLALTPVFLLSGLATMLNVFTTRLGRVADRADLPADDSTQRQLQRLRLRSRILDAAVLLAALAGVLTCCAALTLFLGALRNAGDGKLLFGLFGGALACLILALTAFSVETILSGRSVREQTKRRP
ncbi:DUF2721 domain-containing protein [Sphingomonas sp. RB3P16]|uniref:DUF2721 domain-containing protein n=1 Tax=Parasphingomonas frigoris TaxID=3096163 RepID=UPI002FC956D3